MVTFPENLVAIKYSGYFWDVKEKKLYSIKVGGKLRQLKKLDIWPLIKYSKRAQWGKQRLSEEKYYYKVSDKGVRKFLFSTYLEELELQNSVIEYQEN